LGEKGGKVAQICSQLVVALGANQPSSAGDPEVTLGKAVDALIQSQVVIRSVSPFYRTPCFPAGAGPDYVNAAVALEAPWTPAQALAELHKIENSFGRVRDQRWGQRTLDMDLIACGDQVAPDLATYTQWRDLNPEAQSLKAPDTLILPHPRLQDRAFVLVPMADVAPDWRHPVSGLTVLQMLAALPKSLRDEVKAL
jgi:2-amino-4-hydroxy-6-hydroxymethyldihydropteridine diphosphokinase